MSPMGIEPRTFGVGSDRSTNWANTTAKDLISLNFNRKSSEPAYQDQHFKYVFKNLVFLVTT